MQTAKELAALVAQINNMKVIIYKDGTKLIVICGNCKFHCGYCIYKSIKTDLSEFKDITEDQLLDIINTNNITTIDIKGHDPMYCSNRTFLINVFKRVTKDIKISIFTHVSEHLLESRKIIFNRISKYANIIFDKEN